MQIAQRTLLVAVLICSVMLCCFVRKKDTMEKHTEQWEQIRVEEFLRRIIRKQELTTDEYLLFLNAVKYVGDTVDICLEVYRKEWDMEERGYYYLISQEEILRTLEQESSIWLEEGSVIRVELQRDNNRKAYSKLISGKGDR